MEEKNERQGRTAMSTQHILIERYRRIAFSYYETHPDFPEIYEYFLKTVLPQHPFATVVEAHLAELAILQGRNPCQQIVDMAKACGWKKQDLTCTVSL
jgi:hypothetical protein